MMELDVKLAQQTKYKAVIPRNVHVLQIILWVVVFACHVLLIRFDFHLIQI